MKNLIYLATSALLFGDALAGVWIGSCPMYEFGFNVDFSRYTGTWYQIQDDMAFLQGAFGQCVTATYTGRDDGDVDVRNSMVYWPWNFLPITVNLKGKCDSEKGKC